MKAARARAVNSALVINGGNMDLEIGNRFAALARTWHNFKNITVVEFGVKKSADQVHN